MLVVERAHWQPRDDVPSEVCSVGLRRGADGAFDESEPADERGLPGTGWDWLLQDEDNAEDGEGHAQLATWSPAGALVAYARDGGQGASIAVADGRTGRLLHEWQLEDLPNYLMWTPCGTRLIVLRCGEPLERPLVLAAGGGWRQLRWHRGCAA